MANRRFIDFPIASTSGDTDIILIWQGGANKQTTKATFLSGLPENLEDLNDVAISGLTNGQILRYDSVTGKWENTDQGNLDLSDLNDVSIVSPSNGQVLVYNSSTSQWENSSGGYVPYVGAVTTVDLGAQGLRAGYVRFDTSIVSVPNEQGIMFWDADDETVDIILNGYTMKIGEDLFYPVKNQTGSTIAKGVAVRFNGTVGASGRLLIAPFIADGSVPSSRFMGVTAEEILNGEDGKVLYFGRVRGINTNAFNEGDILYASTTVAGGYQTAIPVAPNNIVQVAAVVTKSATVGTIFVRPTLGSNINKDEGVKITSVADKNLLQYQSGTSLWENKTLEQVIGSDYVPSTRTITINGTSQDLSTNRTYNVGTVTSVGLSSATSGVTIGSTPVTTSGTITLAIATASGSQNGLLSSTDWTTFNNKQNALTNPVTGTGTTNYLPKFTGASTIGNSNLINDSSGNLGLGVTPSAWDGTLIRAIQITDNGGSISSFSTGNTSSKFTFVSNNAFYDNAGWKYATNGSVAQYRLANDNHQWHIAPSGTAGNAISFTQAMTLFATGNLLVGTPSPISDNGARLQVDGVVRTTNKFVSTLGNNQIVFESLSATTGYQYLQLLNNTAHTIFGIEGTAAGSLLTGGTANASVFTTVGNTNLEFGTNQVKRLTIAASTGAATFSSSVTAGGDVNITTGAFRSQGEIVIRRNGNEIRTGSGDGSDYLVYYSGAAERMRITSGGEVLIGNTDNGAYNLQCNGTGVWGQGAYVNGSDRNIKDNISTIEKGLEYIQKINPVKFRYKPNYTRDHSMQTGFIAQELQEVFASEDYLSGLVQKGVHLSVAYQNLLPILVKAIQELKQEIDTLKN